MLSWDIRRVYPFYFRCHSFNFELNVAREQGAIREPGAERGDIKVPMFPIVIDGSLRGAHPRARTYCPLPKCPLPHDGCRRTEARSATLGCQKNKIGGVGPDTNWKSKIIILLRAWAVRNVQLSPMLKCYKFSSCFFKMRLKYLRHVYCTLYYFDRKRLIRAR